MIEYNHADIPSNISARLHHLFVMQIRGGGVSTEARPVAVVLIQHCTDCFSG